MKKITLFSLLVLLSTSSIANTSFYYYSQSQRINTLESLGSAVESRYSLWEIKQVNMGIDGKKLFKAAIEQEKMFIDVEAPLAKAESNINFHGRVKKLIASFKDTHFSGKENTPLPNVLNGLKINPITEDGIVKAIITAKSKKIMELHQAQGGEGMYSLISVGDEVLAIDGVNITEVISKIKLYIAGSSKGFIASAAVRNLSRRNFNYPTKNYSEWTIKPKYGSEYKVRLPWFVDKTSRRDVKVFFAAKKFQELKDLYYSWNEEKMKWIESEKLNYTGYSRFDAPNGLMNISEWNSEDSVELRTGYFIKKGKSYGYLQLFSFTNSYLTKKDGSEKSFGNVVSIFKDFIKELKTNNTPLIFDLRVNFGGNSAIAIQNLSSMAKLLDSYPSRTIAYRTTQFMQQVFNTSEYDPALAGTQEFNDMDMVIAEFDHAVSIGKKYTNIMLQTDPITADKGVGGYELPVVSLISPWCISACDNQAFLMKSSNRVTLIGEPANGTGAGFKGNRYHGTGFVDPLFIVKVRIPNYLFGLPIVSDQRVLEDTDGSLLFKNNSENKAVTPHLDFNYSRSSYQDNSADWIKKAIEVINTKEPVVM